MASEMNSQELHYFIYKDMNLIDSLYSQIFGGNTEQISQAMSTSKKSSGGATGNAAIVKCEVSSSSEESKENSQVINPHDFKVLQLLDELNLKESKHSELQQSKIIMFNGKIRSMNIDKLLPLVSTTIPSNARKGFTANQIKEMIIMFAPGTIFLLNSKENQSYIMPVNDSYLALSVNDINRIYGEILPGEYTVIGVYQKNNLIGNSLMSEMSGVTYAIIKEMLKVNISNEHVIVPILVYQNIIR